MAVTARQVEAPIIKYAHDLGHGAELQEHFEDKPQPFLNRHVGILDDQADRIAHEADRQGDSKFAALGIGKQAGGQPAADRVQLELRYCSL